MHFDEPFERVDRVVVEIWRASGRIERAGRTERIEIEVTQASSWSAELRVLPWKQRRYRWGRRQQEIFVQLADQLADVLAGRTREADRAIDLTAEVPRVIDMTSPAVPSNPALGLGID